MHRHAVEQPWEARTPVVGDQQDTVIATLKLRRERMRGEHVPTRASRGHYEIHPARLSPLHFTT